MCCRDRGGGNSTYDNLSLSATLVRPSVTNRFQEIPSGVRQFRPRDRLQTPEEERSDLIGCRHGEQCGHVPRLA